MRTANHTTTIACGRAARWRKDVRTGARSCSTHPIGFDRTQTQIVFMYGPGLPDDYGAAVDSGGSPSTAPTGNSAIQIWSPSGVNCPVLMRAMG